MFTLSGMYSFYFILIDILFYYYIYLHDINIFYFYFNIEVVFISNRVGNMWEVDMSGLPSTKAYQCQCLRMATLLLLEDVSNINSEKYDFIFHISYEK